VRYCAPGGVTERQADDMMEPGQSARLTDAGNAGAITAPLQLLFDDPSSWRPPGRTGRCFVERQHDLDTCAATFLGDPEECEGRRPPGRATDQVRAVDQPQDREGPWPRPTSGRAETSSAGTTRSTTGSGRPPTPRWTRSSAPPCSSKMN